MDSLTKTNSDFFPQFSLIKYFILRFCVNQASFAVWLLPLSLPSRFDEIHGSFSVFYPYQFDEVRYGVKPGANIESFTSCVCLQSRFHVASPFCMQMSLKHAFFGPNMLFWVFRSLIRGFLTPGKILKFKPS